MRNLHHGVYQRKGSEAYFVQFYRRGRRVYIGSFGYDYMSARKAARAFLATYPRHAAPGDRNLEQRHEGQPT